MSQTSDSKQFGPDPGKTGVDRLTRTEDARPTQIYLVPYPKIVFLYPTFLVAIVAAIWMSATGRQTVGPEDLTAVVITWVFLGIAAVNVMVLAFDFPRATSLTMMFLLAAAILGAVLTFTLRPGLLPTVADLLQTIRPVANSTFFIVSSVLFTLIYAAVLFSVRFDYWEVRPNELLHHHGILSDLKRFSAPNLRIDKEINDVFEYMLLGSGRLILQPSGERRAIILDNVLFISKKETAITRMLGALQVEVRPEWAHADPTRRKRRPAALWCASARRHHRPRWKPSTGELVTPCVDRDDFFVLVPRRRGTRIPRALARKSPPRCKCLLSDGATMNVTYNRSNSILGTLCWCSLMASWFVCCAVVEGADKRNVLFLFADDQRADTLSAWGNPHIRTPNLDKLAKEGFCFRSNYCFGGNSGAVCVPSRAMLMSGKTWFRVDTASLNGVKLLPELLRENGYVTFGTGKWHNGQTSWLRAFQRGSNIFFGGMADHTKVPVRDLGPDGKLTEVRTGEKFSSELFADAVIQFLEEYDGDQPFFAYVAFTAPHDPRQPPPGFADPYYEKRLPLPANFLPQHPFDNGMMRGGRDENLAAWPRTENVIRDQLAEYYGMVTHLDGQIGRILAALQQSGKADNTLIVYAADNGLAVGSHGLLGKQSVYEHSMHVPLIVAGRGIPTGKSTDAFTYLLDLFPTLCDVLGIQPPEDLDGASLRPLWEGKLERVRDTVFLPFLDIQRAVRDDRWKLICYPKIGYMQLFDLQADPDEQQNLIDRADCRAQTDRLLELMRQWQTKVGDTLELPTASKPYEPVDLTGMPREPDQWQPAWIVKKYFDATANEPAKR